ncbi:MAG: signal recognition particle-docking protein FtsY [Myxococcota bacterium]
MDPANNEVIEVPSEATQDFAETTYDAGVLAWAGGLSGALVLVAFVVFFFVRGRRSNQAVFEEPQVAVVPEDHKAAPPSTGPTEPAQGLAGLLRSALGRSRAALQGRFDVLFGRNKIDDALFEDLEETLLLSDVGVHTTDSIVQELRDLVSSGTTEPSELREALRTCIRDRLVGRSSTPSPPADVKPWVVLVVGVNGSGKTTTIGKLAARFKEQGLSVMMAAGDTYRAAAAEQLAVWAERSGADIVRGEAGSDPGAVVYQAVEAAQARGHDVVLVDTAGRLQTAAPLMEQLSKVRRVIDKRLPGAPHDTLLVLDGTMGQNGLSQARLFHDATPLTGVAITKLDGTAKGGMIVTLASELDLPIKLIGIGEGVSDLKDFDADAFAEAIA